MWGVLRRNPFGTIIALVLHVAVLGFMFVGISNKEITTSSNGNVRVIRARVVNTRKIDSSIKQSKSSIDLQQKAKNVEDAHLANIKSSQDDDNKTTSANVDPTDHQQQETAITKPKQKELIQEKQVSAKIAASEHLNGDTTGLLVEQQRKAAALITEEQQQRKAAAMIAEEQQQREAAARIVEEQQQREAAAMITEEQRQREAAAMIAEEQRQREAAAMIAVEQKQHKVAAEKNRIKQGSSEDTNSSKITPKKKESIDTPATDQNDDQHVHVVSSANTSSAGYSQDTLGQKQYDVDLDELSEVHGKIKRVIYRTWRIPPYSSNLRCTLKVNISEDGDVLAVRIVKSSGNKLFDASAERAVERASPLPVPKNRNLFDENLELVFDPTAAD